MERRTKFGLTMDEMLKQLYEEDEGNIEKADVVVIPPDVDDLTDKDETCDDLTDEATVQDVPGSLELHIENKTELPADHTTSTKPVLAPHNKRVLKLSGTRKRKLRESQPNWRFKHPEYNKVKQRGISHQENLKKNERRNASSYSS